MAAVAHIEADAPGGVAVRRLAPVHLLLPVGGMLQLTDAMPVRVPCIVLAVQKMSNSHPVAVELVLVGEAALGMGVTAARIDMRIGRYTLREMTVQDCLVALLHHAETIPMCVAGKVHHVPLWIVTEGTPLVGRIGFDGVDAVARLLGPLGFDLEAH